MAGFLGFFDYTKEGKGAYADEPPKGPLATFFAILGRKFWKIVTLNLMYILFSLPLILLSFFAAQYVLNCFLPNLTLTTLIQYVKEAGLPLKEGISEEGFAASQLFLLYMVVGFALTGLTFVIAGPVHAGVTYILRNYSREKHAFVWSDFREHAMKNFKQSLISSLINLGLVVVIPFIFWFYSNYSVFGSATVSSVLQTIIVILAVLWYCMQIYLFPMMVTFDMPLKVMYKNCLLFAMMRLPINLLITAVSLLIVFVLPAILLFWGLGVTMLLALFWYLLFAFGLNMLITTFFSYRAIDRYMISKLRAAEELNEEAQEDEDETAADADEEPEEEKGQENQPDDNEDTGLAKAPSHS